MADQELVEDYAERALDFEQIVIDCKCNCCWTYFLRPMKLIVPPVFFKD